MLIKHYYHEVKAGGGPAGYLRNLQLASESRTDTRAHDNILVSDEVALGKGRRASLARIKRRLVSDVVPNVRVGLRPREAVAARFAITVDWLQANYSALSRSDVRRLFECDFAVAHSVILAERMMQLCPVQSSRKLLVMTHSPTFLSHELILTRFPDGEQSELLSMPFVRALTEREQHVMTGARGVIWPCPEAADGYAVLEPSFDLSETNPIYAMTGVAQPRLSTMPQAMRTAWGIEDGQRILLFLGRGHPHKGFGRFVDWADLCSRRGLSEFVFVHGGDAGPTGRDLSSVRRVGFVRDNAAAYLAADLVLIPNLQSYMDIGLLETLSLGTRVAVSPTGGHARLLARHPEIPSIPSGTAEETWPFLRAILDQQPRPDRFHDIWRTEYSLHQLIANHLDLMSAL